MESQSQTRYRDPARLVMVASLLYATYLTVTCPCDVVVECKQGQFYMATAVPLVLAIYLNANRLA